MLREKEKLLVTSNFSFSYSVFQRLVLQTHQKQGLFGKRVRKDNIPLVSITYQNADFTNKVTQGVDLLSTALGTNFLFTEITGKYFRRWRLINKNLIHSIQVKPNAPETDFTSKIYVMTNCSFSCYSTETNH